MRAEIKKLKENNYRTLLLLTLGIVAFLFIIYMIAVNKIKKVIINSVDKIGNNYVEFSYEKIKITVYPFFIKTTLSNASINAGINGGDSIKFKIDEIVAKNIIFSKNIDVKLPENVKIFINNGNAGDIVIKNNYITLSLGEKYILKDIDVFVDNLELSNDSDENVILGFENITFKLVKLIEEDYSNTTTRLNIDKIFTKIVDKGIETENNLEVIISSVKEFDSTKDVVNVSNIIDTFNFSDITNNYAFNIYGSYSAGKVDRNISVDVEMEIVNYNYLISALNDKSDYYFINKPKLSNFVQLLELVPANKKNTKNNRYYKIIGSSSNKVLLLNDEDFNNIVKKVFYRNNM